MQVKIVVRRFLNFFLLSPYFFTPMWPYLATFLASLASDSLPIIGPPVWTIMVFMQVKFDLNPWIVLGVGVPASVLGRYGLSQYSSRFTRKFITKAKAEEMEFVGKKLNGRLWEIWPFVLLYSLLPLSTTALFFAAGLARIRPLQILPPFFVGKFISDAVMLFTSSYALREVSQPGFQFFTAKSITLILSSLVIIAVFLFLDWRRLVERKQVRFEFRIWQ